MRREQIRGGVEAALRAISERALAHHHFDGSRHPDDAARAFGIERHVPQVSGPANGAAQQPALREDGAADARAQREQNHVLPSARRTDPRFADEGGVRIVEHHRPG